MPGWWDQWPGRLEHELEALQAACIRHELDRVAFERGKVIIKLWPVVNGAPLSLEAVFPDLYPYFRFEVHAPEVDLPHHQHPFGKNLCFLSRATGAWRSTDTLAAFIVERLPRVLEAGSTDDPTATLGVEEEQAEPFSDYYAYHPRAYVLVESHWTLPDGVRSGECVVGARRTTVPLQGAVLNLTSGGRVLASASPEITRRYPGQLKGRWIRLDQPIRENQWVEFLRTLGRTMPNLLQEQWNRTGEGRIDIVAVAFPEEVAWRRMGLGWVFLVRNQKTGDRKVTYGYFARVIRSGEDDMAPRAPELRAMRRQTIAVFGAGALGGHSVLEFARAGVGRLNILDHDIVDAPQTVRWPSGLRSVGLPKAEALRELVEGCYPYTAVVPFVHRLGVAAREGPSDVEVLEKVLAGVNLIYDATAEIGIQHLLSDLAAQRRIPYIAISGTQGAWGGLVLRLGPGQTSGCWGCFQHALFDGTIPSPPADPNGMVQPAGCADPTFTGAGFDLLQVALQGVRLAAGTLCGSSAGGYPDVSWDVAVASLRDRNGMTVPIRWESFPLDRHPACQAHEADGPHGLDLGKRS